MSREIKFELVAKNMSGKILREVYTLDDLMGFEESHSVDIIAKRQYTGLKDKNGVEIYERDIMRHDAFKKGSDIDVVEYCDDDAAFEFLGCASEWETHCEVIGNIFENPELLDKE